MVPSENLPIRGSIFNVQRFSLHDGPGIRTTAFLKGCPLTCPWCHNPESRSRDPESIRNAVRCISCEACLRACPTGAVKGEPSRCIRCGACAGACPTGAREVLGRDVTSVALVGELLLDRIFFEESGGGVTFSGGEPLAQPEFLLACLGACRAEGLHTALDTCGFGPRETLLAAAELADLVLYDLKLMDDEAHEEMTGVPSRVILDNLRTLAASHDAVWLRVPVVPGVNDTEENMEAAAALARDLPGIRRVCLLPYHHLGAEKSTRMGLPGPFGPVAGPRLDTLARLAAPFERAGFPVSIGG